MFKDFSSMDETLSRRFILPVIAENLLTTVIYLFYIRITSTISSNALAAIGLVNNMFSTLFSVFSMVTVGSSVLVARYVGAEDRENAAQTVEQSLLLSILISLFFTVLCEILSGPILRLLMPGAEADMMREARFYYTILMLSTPFYVVYSSCASVERAMGNARIPMFVTVLMNVGLVVFGFVFITLLGLSEIGAGLSMLLCRAGAAVFFFIYLLRDHRFFRLKFRNLLKPVASVWRRICAIGIPCSVESIFVQAGYLVCNSMIIALGALNAETYEILMTIYNFMAFPHSITSQVALPAVGHLLGAGRVNDAKRSGKVISIVGFITILVLGLFCVILRRPLASLYTSTPEALQLCSKLMWIAALMALFGGVCNSVDPQLRAGGDTRFVMINAIIGVWGIRIPLTYLLCFVFDLGAAGVIIANTVTLLVRCSVSVIRRLGTKWYAWKL